LGGRELESDREDVEACEDVFDRGISRSRDSHQVASAQVDEVEDPLLVELIGIVELTRDDPPAVGEGLDERVDERLIVETRVAAGRTAGVVTLESTETVDEPVGLRTVAVREDGESLANDDR